MATLHTPVSLPSSPRPPSRPRMNSALTLVTPEKAQALLATAYQGQRPLRPHHVRFPDRKSTRLNSSHSQISYAVFCLKKTMTMLWRARLLPTVGRRQRCPPNPAMWDHTTPCTQIVA